MSDAWATLSAQLPRGALLLAVLGLSLGALTWTPLGLRLDRGVFCAINRLPAVPALDWLMWSITHLGSVWAGMVALTFSFRVQRDQFGLIFTLSLLTQSIVIGVSKVLSQRPRPFLQLSGVRVIGLRPVDLSYPSGHSALAFNMATLLAFGLPLSAPARIIVYGLATGVGYSRVHLGVHYPLDVLAGATFGIGWGLLWSSFLV